MSSAGGESESFMMVFSVRVADSYENMEAQRFRGPIFNVSINSEVRCSEIPSYLMTGYAPNAKRIGLPANTQFDYYTNIEGHICVLHTAGNATVSMVLQDRGTIYLVVPDADEEQSNNRQQQRVFPVQTTLFIKNIDRFFTKRYAKVYMSSLTQKEFRQQVFEFARLEFAKKATRIAPKTAIFYLNDWDATVVDAAGVESDLPYQEGELLGEGLDGTERLIVNCTIHWRKE